MERTCSQSRSTLELQGHGLVAVPGSGFHQRTQGGLALADGSRAGLTSAHLLPNLEKTCSSLPQTQAEERLGIQCTAQPCKTKQSTT